MTAARINDDGIPWNDGPLEARTINCVPGLVQVIRLIRQDKASVILHEAHERRMENRYELRLLRAWLFHLLQQRMGQGLPRKRLHVRKG